MRCASPPESVVAGCPKPYISQPHIKKCLKLPFYFRIFSKERKGFFNGHIQHLCNILSLVCDLKGLAVEAFSMADFAGDIDIGEENAFLW